MDKELRSEQALKLAVAEIYGQGVATRKVTAITFKPCGYNILTSEIGRVVAEFYGILSEPRNCPLEPVAYPILDARYEQAR
jgi:transposase-like protein